MHVKFLLTQVFQPHLITTFHIRNFVLLSNGLFYAAIIKSLIGAPDSVTDAITIGRISVLYNDLLSTLKTFDFLVLTDNFIYQVSNALTIIYVAITLGT